MAIVRGIGTRGHMALCVDGDLEIRPGCLVDAVNRKGVSGQSRAAAGKKKSAEYSRDALKVNARRAHAAIMACQEAGIEGDVYLGNHLPFMTTPMIDLVF